MTDFIPGGPPRYEHQRRGIQKFITTGGVTALLFDPGTGKGLALCTEVPTPEGWTTMGDLVTGDLVLAPDGSTTRIVAHEPYEAVCWQLVFSDGAEVVADEDHLWVTDDRNDRRRARYNHVPVQGQVRTTAEVVKSLTRPDGAHNHRIELTAPVDLNTSPLVIDPYLLGIWLGDGRADGGVLSLNAQDASEIMENIGDSRLRITRAGKGVAYVSTARGSLALGHELRALGVLDNKHIPMQYLRADRHQRAALLRGLMDSDGYTDRRQGTVEFTSTRQQLAEAVRELACSLGERVTIAEGRATLYGEDKGPRWRVTWTPRQVDPFLLSRKSISPEGRRPSGRYLVSAHRVGVQTVRCLTVDSPTAQFLITRSWLPTHNTAVVVDYACLLALKSPTKEARVLVVAPLAAVDTWVLQMQEFASPQVTWWAEVLGGGLLERAEALASRGGNPYKRGLVKGKRRIAPGAERALHHEKAWAWAASERTPPVTPSEGPDFTVIEPDQEKEFWQLVDRRPRVVMEIINIDTLVRRTEVGSKTMADVMVDAIKRFAPDLLVIDEAHKIKSAGGNASRLLARVAKFVRRRGILTGTVMPHSPLDVFAQWRFLEPYAFGRKDPATGVLKQAVLSDFYQYYTVMGGFYGKEVKGYDHLEDMQRIMARNAVVARKSECLDLPPTTDVIVPVTLSPAEIKAYRELKKTMATDLASGLVASVDSVLVLGMRLRQITSGHIPTDDHGPMEVVGRSKVDVIKSLVEDTLVQEKRIVIFCLFTFEIKMLAQVLSIGGDEIMVIEGGTPMETRARLRRRFGSDDPQRMIMIAQIKTMSVSVNELVTASHAIFGSLSQERDDLVQAKARLDRVGQTRPVTFWMVMAPHTIDGVIYRSHQDRTNLEDAMLKHIQDSQAGGV